MSNSFYDSNRALLDQMAQKYPDERRRDEAKLDALNAELAGQPVPEEDE